MASSDFPEHYADYHRDTLIDPARTRGFGVENGRDISDLQLLAKLQHFGAATGLLNFTWSPLVGLWFASDQPNYDGKLFVLNTNDPSYVSKVGNDPKLQTFDAALSNADDPPLLYYWEPVLGGEAAPRLFRQRGVFIIGRPLIPDGTQIVTEIEISKEDKAALREDLAFMDIDESWLFPDIYGFSRSQGVTASVQVRDSEFYFVQGNQHQQEGNYVQAIRAYDSCIDRSPETGELYLLRGNAKSELGRYSEAVEDYKQAIAYRCTLQHGEWAGSGLKEIGLTFLTHFSCGNALAKLHNYEAAVNSYSEAIRVESEQAGLGKDDVLFNRGNTYLDLGQYAKAIADYDRALSLQANDMEHGHIMFNKGTALVLTGRFQEAIDCYIRAGQRHDDRAADNHRVVEEIMDAGNQGGSYPFWGRVGNVRTFGWEERGDSMGFEKQCKVTIEGKEGKWRFRRD